MPDAARANVEDTLPVSTDSLEKAGGDAEDGVDQAKAAGKQGAAQVKEGAEAAKKGLNKGLDQVGMCRHLA